LRLKSLKPYTKVTNEEVSFFSPGGVRIAYFLRTTSNGLAFVRECFSLVKVKINWDYN
jgi:hypothetical protein